MGNLYASLGRGTNKQEPEGKESDTPKTTEVGTKVPRYQGTTNKTHKRRGTDDLVDALRRAVMQENKYAANYRLSQTEKEALADMIYALNKQGLKTTEIEIARVAINWLINDYNERAEESVLVKVLESKWA